MTYITPGKYRHFKGSEYELLGTAYHSETLEEMVIYRALYGEKRLWIRPLSMWNAVVERDGKTVRRFSYIGCGDLGERFLFRPVCAEDAEEAAAVEAVCFPPEEACTLPIMRERAELASDSFLTCFDRASGKMTGFINGLCTNDETLNDEIFTDTTLHDPSGKNLMICSVSVLPEYRMQGLAREMMRRFLTDQQAKGREKAVLTCVPGKVGMYEKFGFTDCGRSSSAWGGETWNEMFLRLNGGGPGEK